MALTKVTSLVLQSNVISNTKIATAAIESRHISNSSILARHLGASANNAIVQSNVNTVQDNVTATEVRRVANVEALQANLNANVNIVQNNVADIINGIPFTGEVTISNQLGVGNTNPTPTSITLGEPANVTIDYGAQGGNVYIGMAGVSPFRLDVRGTANTGALTATGATVSGLTASKALQTNGSKALESSSVTTTELGYVSGVTSAIQTQLTAQSTEATAIEARRAANVAGAISTVTTSDLTVSRALVSSGSGKITQSGTTSAEIAYIGGLSSAVQTQLDSKAALAGASFTGQVNMADDLVVTGNLVVNGDQTVANSVNLVVQDRIIMVSNSTTGTPSQDAGIFVNRGNQGNAAIVYDESITAFALYDTKDPHTNTAISPVTHGNLVIGTANVFGVANTGALTTTGVTVSGLTASKALQTNGSKALESSSVTTTELGYVSGVTSAIQTQLDAHSTEDAAIESRRAANVAGAISSVLTSDLTASRAMVTDGSGKISVDTGVTATELGYLDATSSIQTQMDTKAADSAVLKKDGSVALTANWDAGSYEIRSATFESDIATGTAPFTIASTTAVTNLNADLLDGNHAAVFDTQSNAHDTFTKLNANLNVVSSNAAAALPKAGGTMTGAIAMSTNKITGLGDPTAAQDAATKAYVTSQLGASIVPTFTTNTTSGTSNVFALTNSPANINRISVFIGGAAQTPTTDYIHVTGNNSIQFTDASVPASIQLVIHEWDTA